MRGSIRAWLDRYQGRGATGDSPFYPQGHQEGNRSSFEWPKFVTLTAFQSTGGIREMLKNRAEVAGLRYIAPHQFRHIFIRETANRCQSIGDFKAISQSIGHESLQTTLAIYGNFSSPMLQDRLINISFSGKSPDRHHMLSDGHVIHNPEKQNNPSESEPEYQKLMASINELSALVEGE